MNIKIITSFFKRYWPLGLIILWAAGCWAFFQFCYPYHFFYKEQNQIFLWTADYLQSYNGPGWLARLTGDFFTQFYYYIFAGAAILTAILLLLGDIIRRIFQNLGCGKWAYQEAEDTCLRPPGLVAVPRLAAFRQTRSRQIHQSGMATGETARR